MQITSYSIYFISLIRVGAQELVSQNQLTYLCDRPGIRSDTVLCVNQATLTHAQQCSIALLIHITYHYETQLSTTVLNDKSNDSKSQCQILIRNYFPIQYLFRFYYNQSMKINLKKIHVRVVYGPLAVSLSAIISL